MDQEKIEQKLGTIDELPTLPMVLRQLQKVMANPNSNMNQIAIVVAKDQALAARTIRLVNSAFYTMRNRVTSITQAIVVLGLNTLRNLMLGLSVIKMFRNSQTHGFDPTLFWEHSFGCALIARKLGKEFNYPDPDECFICGLLHDMGRLVLEQFVHKDFIEALKNAREKKTSLFASEQEIFGFDHGDIGGWLAMKWAIPPILITVIQYHHHPEQIPDELSQYNQITHIIAAADFICNSEKIGNSGEHILPEIVANTREILSRVNVQEIAAEARSEVSATLAEWHK